MRSGANVIGKFINETHGGASDLVLEFGSDLD